MKHNYTGEYGGIRLCPLAVEDIEKMRLLRNKNKKCFVYSKEISAEKQKKWYTEYLNKKNDYMFSVFADGAWTGAVSIYDVDATNGTAEFGRLMIDRTAADRGGLGYEATVCACRIAFRCLCMRKIRLEVYADNEPAKKTYLKAGFTSVGERFDDFGEKMLLMELNRKEEKICQSKF
jgi:RimJ/RimL family protein N-acetyltransferase